MSMLLYHVAGRESGPRLADFMGIRHALRGGRGDRDCLKGWARPEFLIRYGSAAAVPRKATHRVLNRRWALSQYANRLEQMRLLRDGGVNVPFFVSRGGNGSPLFDTHRRTTHEVQLLGRDFGRPGRQTTKGRGITEYIGVNVPFDPDTHDMMVEYIDKDRQFRTHVICGATRTREWIPNDGDYDDPFSVPIWNYENGTYRVPDDIPSKVVPIAAQAVAALRLDFGAVDIIVEDSNVYVLEVNTAPGLGDETLEWYAEHLGYAVGITTDTMPGWDAAERLPTNTGDTPNE